MEAQEKGLMSATYCAASKTRKNNSLHRHFKGKLFLMELMDDNVFTHLNIATLFGSS